MLMTTNKFLRWMYCVTWMDERVATSKKCWIGNREEDTGDLKISELNELVESMTRLNALEGKI